MIRPTARSLGWCLAMALFLAANVNAGAIDSVRTTVASWRNAWQSRNLEQYLAHYHPRFQSDGLDRTQWGKKKARIFRDSGRIDIRVEDLWITAGSRLAVARFLQHYRSRNWSEVGEKELTLARVGGGWQIVKEQWRPLDSDSPAPRPKKTDPNGQHGKPDPPLPAMTIPGNESGPIRFLVTEASEKVFIGLKHYFIPMVSAIGGEDPKIVIDIQGVAQWQGNASIPVNGRLIQRIRSYLHRKNRGKLRIVLDLNTGENLILKRTYLRAKNILCLEIKQRPLFSPEPDSS